MDLMNLLLKLVIQQNVMGIWYVMQLDFSCVLKLIIYRIIIMKEYRPNINSFFVLFASLEVLVDIIQLLFLHVCCIFCVVFIVLC